jgi:hypothetical protein
LFCQYFFVRYGPAIIGAGAGAISGSFFFGIADMKVNGLVLSALGGGVLGPSNFSKRSTAEFLAATGALGAEGAGLNAMGGAGGAGGARGFFGDSFCAEEFRLNEASKSSKSAFSFSFGGGVDLVKPLLKPSKILTMRHSFFLS